MHNPKGKRGHLHIKLLDYVRGPIDSKCILVGGGLLFFLQEFKIPIVIIDKLI